MELNGVLNGLAEVRQITLNDCGAEISLKKPCTHICFSCDEHKELPGSFNAILKEELIMAQKILIYGSSGGIGSATGCLLRARRYDFHLVGRDTERVAAIARELGATSTLGYVNDSALFSRAAQDAGAALDGLVYAVGTINLRSLGRLTEADFLTDFRVNAMGAALAIQAVLPALKKSEAGLQ